MPHYIVNMDPQEDGLHELHDVSAGCTYMPAAARQLDLGERPDAHAALAAARAYYHSSSGCYYCTRECHPDHADHLARIKIDSA